MHTDTRAVEEGRGKDGLSNYQSFSPAGTKIKLFPLAREDILTFLLGSEGSQSA